MHTIVPVAMDVVHGNLKVDVHAEEYDHIGAYSGKISKDRLRYVLFCRTVFQ